MENKWILFWVILSSFLPFGLNLDQASFYGGSYIAIPLKEARSSTDIHFKFRTHLPNALLLLVAGATDYCIIRLDTSRLKVTINLGAGESELYSAHNLKLDDLRWHDVFIVRKEGDLSMIIDNAHTFSTHLPGDFFELNIHFGLFVGGIGNLTDLFFGHMENFRGCLAEVMYNGILVLDQARRRQSQATVHGVTWNCAAEFESPVERAISFVEDNAFMAISHAPSHTLKIQTEIKTLVEHSIVLYNAGPPSKQDLFALEIWKGKLKIILKHNDKSIECMNDEYVSDGHWHKISLKVNVNMIELNVDSRTKTVKAQKGHVVDYTNLFYVGGIEITKRTRAMSKGLKTTDSSFKGCIKHIIIGDKQKGFPDVRVSEGLLPGCVWQYPCLRKPCEENGVCVQQGLDSFQCQCQDKSCNNSNVTDEFKVFSRSNFATELELLALEPLETLEGQSALITSSNLHMILDYPKYGIKDFGIKYMIVESPAHGSISIDVWPHEKNVFTLADISRDKVHYIHDGSETLRDSIVLEVEFSAGEFFILPAYLQGKHRFTLAVNISPVNDPPSLKSLATNVLRIAQGSRKVISPALLQANDPDSPVKDLVYSILDPGPGHFEFLHKPAMIKAFTQEDVDNNKVVYIHNMAVSNDSFMSLQVSDGIETSPPIKLRVSAFPLHWRIKNNTGIVLMHSTCGVITPYNLSFISNVANASDAAQFHIIQNPQFGVVQVEKDVAKWENSVIFTTDDLKQHRVRYQHLTSRPDYDEFQFRTTLNMSMLHTFRVSFAKCRLYSITGKSLNLNGVVEGVLNLDNVEYQTTPVASQTTSIIFQIEVPPKYGYLFSSVSKYQMRVHDTFTQEDLISQNLRYRLYRKSYSQINDLVVLNIAATGCKNVTKNFTIVYVPNNETLNKIQVNIQALQVEEGSKTIIPHSHIYIQSNFITDLFFNVTENPKHGVLQVNKNNGVRNNSNYFTLEELRNGMVFYIHDNSETRSDSFKFMVLSKEEEDFLYVDTFNIKVILKNDNSPTRVVDKVFHIVVGGERMLTTDDLSYKDEDLDTQATDIIYTFRELPNGEFYNSINRNVKLSEFTQDDLNNRRVLFKHKGPEYGKIKFWVTDGPFYVIGVLEVQASAPFIKVSMNKRLIIQHGTSSVITNEHLNFNTNLFAGENDVTYEIINKPSFGKMIYNHTNKIVYEFTQAEINKGSISYLNEITTSSADEVGLKVKCRDAISTAQLSIWMLPLSYWKPLQLKTSKTLLVEESTSAIISKSILEIIQPDVPPNAISYHITTPPAHGYLSILPTSQKNDIQSIDVKTFTQSLVNENRIIYIQSVANETKDQVIFNVTNGMVWLHEVSLEVQVIPERLYLGSNLMSVNEGGTVVITSVNIYIITDYYKSRVSDYVLLEEPKFGCIQIYKRCSKLHGFSHKELVAGVVHYAHNGSEHMEDNIVLIAVAGEKRSIPIVLNIKVVPINNKKPKLVNNTGLIMWEGGSTIITNSVLAAIDDDRPIEVLKYQVLGCWFGNISLLSNPEASLHFFTQDLINKNMIVFRHENGSDAKFMFNISDGLHSTKEYTFNIKTKPVHLNLFHKPLHIFPLQCKYLTASNLLATVSDPTREIHYEVIIPPILGRLMMESSKSPGIFNVISHFTQSDLNNSKVFYEHTHPFAGLYANDSLIYSVNSHLAKPLVNKVLKIDISVSSGGLDAYVNIPKITVDEGGLTKVILNISAVVSFLETHAGLRSPVIHASTTNPQHGQIFLQNHQNLTTFTQLQLESGQVQYQHDHSDSLGDNIYLSLYLIPGYIMLCNITVPITINPINDQPFKLVTPAPHLIVVQGEEHVITKSELCTEDVDTMSVDLLYDIISGPQEGRVVLLPEAIPIIHFSQADIDNNKLVYIHNGSALTDTFHLRVWDGKFRPEYTVFNVKVLPICMNVSTGLPVYIQQGMNVVLLSNKQFNVQSNTNRNKIKYIIKEFPKHGVIYVRDNALNEFDQEDLDNDRIMYMQTDMTTASDYFRVFIGSIYGNTAVGKDVEVNIKVQPLMQLGNCTVLSGEINKLSLHVIDATPLAKLTNSNPKYTITSPPNFSQVRKIIRISGDRKHVVDTPVVSFTHEEVQSGLIYLAVRDIEVGWTGILDRLGFNLAASIFQPALGELKIIIKSPLHNDIYSTLAGPNDPAGHEGGMHIASPNMTRDYFLIVSMVAGVIILGVAVIIIIKCRTFESEDLNKDDQCLQPIPLPRPPDRLMASSPPLKMSDGFSPPIPATLPHCKVTPLSRNDLDTNARYPYGVDEHSDDWSSCDASDPTCPSSRNNIMLRRNQYWV